MIINKMPRRKVRLTTRRRACKPCSGGRRKRAVVRRGRRRTRNSKHLRKWMSHRAKPWMVRGRGFWQDFGRGFSSVFKPFATIGGPILDALGMPEFGVPLSAVGSAL